MSPNIRYLSFFFMALNCLPHLLSGEVVSEYRLGKETKSLDFDNESSALRNKTKFLITGSNKPSQVLEILTDKSSNFAMIATKVNDESIFKPDPEDAKQDQLGFRRLDVLPQYDPTTIETGKKAYHHSLMLSKDSMLDLAHSYLLGSVEDPKTGGHIYDIVLGTDYDAKNTSGKVAPNANKFRVRNMKFADLFTVDAVVGETNNFAIEVDWTKNTVQAFHSKGSENLKAVSKVEANDPKAKTVAGTCEWHIQMIKSPLPDPNDTPEQRNDLVHGGIQKSGILESIVQFRNFVEDTSKDPLTANPEGPAATTSA
ncbi:hypothetical protein PPACK8108_LOCUS11995 [Phakopsora pachyrhizi]|uniref:Glycoside hydrolase 131 catalytic N-terminal domain-containing protein n=1 Tax=Phakopsora pachyrhizi TaxID=170000 RepID=A0AAV0B3J4_PHAPC|nr:hypothetical protein PPACK8108_LOCUS11995 [Phakopsora pachyrhizi]